MRDALRDMWPEHLRTWDERVIEIKAKAIRARREGYHYDGFRVGAAALLYDPASGQYSTIEGSNFKTKPGTDGPRVCAEETPISQAVLRSCLIVGVALACDYQRDDKTHLPFLSLLPCVHCRTKFHILLEDTEFINQQTQFESMRIEGIDGEETIAKTLPFNLESLFVMAPVTHDEVREARKKFRPTRHK